jgi:hypothetical protein
MVIPPLEDSWETAAVLLRMQAAASVNVADLQMPRRACVLIF